MNEADAPGRERDTLERAKRVKLMLFDVDGVLTDGRLWYGPGGETHKAFHVFDGFGIKLLMQAGIAVGFLSGRSSPAVAARAAELGVAHLLQGSEDKRGVFESLLARLGLPPAEAGFMGDEVVDLPVLRRCGFACAPAGAADRPHRISTGRSRRSSPMYATASSVRPCSRRIWSNAEALLATPC